jgi:hypothetical protein
VNTRRGSRYWTVPMRHRRGRGWGWREQLIMGHMFWHRGVASPSRARNFGVHCGSQLWICLAAAMLKLLLTCGLWVAHAGRCLRRGQWLNEEILNTYLGLLHAFHDSQQLAPPAGADWRRARIHIPLSYFYSRLTSSEGVNAAQHWCGALALRVTGRQPL